MMTQIYSQSSDQNLISLPIVKFSHNTSPHGAKIYTWNHIANRADLELNIRRIRYIDEQGNDRTRIDISASAGLEALETQNLSELVRFCNLFDPSSGAEHPVEIAIRSPLIAMRYPKTVNTVRRLQMKLRSHEDYHKVLTILQDMGLPITSRETAAPSAGIPPAPSPALSGAVSIASSSTLRPPSAIDLLALQNACLASSPTRSEFKISAQPESSIPQDRIYSDPPQIAQRFSKSSITPSNASNHAISHVNSMQGPVSGPYASQVQEEFRHRSYSSQRPSHATPVMPQTSLYPDRMRNLQRSQNSMQDLPSGNLSQSKDSAPSLPSASLIDNSDPTAMVHLNHHRPASVPSLPTAETSYSALVRSSSTFSMPPKRELPWAIPEAKKAEQPIHHFTAPKLSSTTPILPPLKTKEPVDDDMSTPAPKNAPKKRVAQRKAMVKPDSRTAVTNSERLHLDNHILTEPDSIPDEPSPLAAKSAAAMGRPVSAPLSLVSKAGAPPRKRTATPRPSKSKTKMIEQGTQTESLENLESASNPTPASSANPSDDYLRAIDNVIRKQGLQPSPPPLELYENPGWAELDKEDRVRLIDNFICDSLDDPDFLKLCEDVDTAWRRIGLDL